MHAEMPKPVQSLTFTSEAHMLHSRYSQIKRNITKYAAALVHLRRQPRPWKDGPYHTLDNQAVLERIAEPPERSKAVSSMTPQPLSTLMLFLIQPLP